eukprot:g3002.t1
MSARQARTRDPFAQWFGGNPLDRSSGDRKSRSFADEALKSPSALFLVVADSAEDRSLALLARAADADASAGALVGRGGAFGVVAGDTRPAVHELLFFTAAQIEKVCDTALAPSLTNAALLGARRSASATTCGAWYWALRCTSTTARDRLARAARGFWTNGRSLIGAAPDPSSARAPAARVKFARADAAVGGQALALWQWHGANTHCQRTGTRTELAEAGSRRREVGGRHRAYPRTDLAAIFLLLSPCGQFALLGKSARFARAGRRGFFSCLAGFVEQCEQVEEAVRREAYEEAGVGVGAVRLYASQPWPVGRAGACELMLGCFARALPGGAGTGPGAGAGADAGGKQQAGGLPPAAPQDGELAAVRWFSKGDVRAMLARAERGITDGDGAGAEVVPGEYAIAHTLMRAWAVEGCDGGVIPPTGTQPSPSTFTGPAFTAGAGRPSTSSAVAAHLASAALGAAVAVAAAMHLRRRG